MRDVILDLKKEGKTILFSTHILSDAETLCDRIAILRAGRLLDVGSLADILRVDVSYMEILVSGVDPARLEVDGLHRSYTLGERHRLEVEEHALGAVVVAVERAGGRILGVQPVRQSLEDYFIQEMAVASAPSAGLDPWGGAD